MDTNNEEIRTIRCECDCFTEELRITKDYEFDFSEPIYYVDFRVDSFCVGQSIFWIMKQRLKLAWLAIRKGNYIHQDLVLKEKNIIEFRDRLSELIDHKLDKK